MAARWTCRLAVLLVALGLGCTVINDFDVGLLAEVSEAQCSDGVDNDDDGLRDCQSYGCLNLGVCCTLPKVFLAQELAFHECAAHACDEEGVSATECLDPAVWQVWGSPIPRLCDGGLHPYKERQCYDVGVLARQPLPLKPGLRIAAGVAGFPEVPARLVVGLTMVGEVYGSPDQCVALTPLDAIVEAVVVWAEGGYQVQARFGGQDLGSSPLVTDETRHTVGIVVGQERRAHYLLDGVVFAISSEDLLLPTDGRPTYVALAGRGLQAHFTDLTASAETQCDTPGGWAFPPTFEGWGEGSVGSSPWESYQVSFPTVVRRSRDTVDLFYVGCHERNSLCDPYDQGISRVTSKGGERFVKHADELDAPLRRVEESISPGHVGTIDLAVVDRHGQVWGYLSDGTAISLLQFDEEAHQLDLEQVVLGLGEVGDFDDAGVCCASVVDHDDVTYLWYAGRSQADPEPVWRVGLATSVDGVTFDKSRDNPVLVPGNRDEFDGWGVTEPAVLYEERRQLFRMWYGARGLFGTAAIGYAVSSDGILWHKYPSNPVVASGDLGLDGIGHPTVLMDEGELRMWIHAKLPGTYRFEIFPLENFGAELGLEP